MFLLIRSRSEHRGHDLLLISSLVDGELDGPRTQLALLRVSKCTTCREAARAFREANGRLARMTENPEDVPSIVSRRLHREIDRRGRSYARPGIMVRRVPGVVGTAVAAILIVIGSGYLHGHTGSGGPGTRVTTTSLESAPRTGPIRAAGTYPDTDVAAARPVIRVAQLPTQRPSGTTATASMQNPQDFTPRSRSPD